MFKEFEMIQATVIDDQPINSTFFSAGSWLTEFVTPDAPGVRLKYEELTQGLVDEEAKIRACWDWVSSIKYKPFIRGRLEIEGKISSQSDLWMSPSMAIHIPYGNCANKSFLLTSLLRNFISADRVYCALGNLHQPAPGGHAWTVVKMPINTYILEATNHDMTPLVDEKVAEIYEPVMYFNDKKVMAVPGRTLLQPFCAVYADWLRDYLDWKYIDGAR
jgi:hypothetical protein